MERIIRGKRAFEIDGSREQAADGRPRCVFVELEFDIERAWQVIGKRAARNKTGRAILGNGILRATRSKGGT